jgi:flagellar biosynthesis protein FlhG
MRERGDDQARGLRRIFSQRGPTMLALVGASGTTAVTLDLALALAHAGRRVLVLDRTCGEAAMGLGLKARYDLAHMLRGERTLEELLQWSPLGVAVLPAARALAAIDDGDRETQAGLARVLAGSRDRFDICLVNGLPPRGAEDEDPHDVMLVTAASREAVTDTYARIKALTPIAGRFRLRVVVNRASTEASAMSIYTSLAETARRFLAAQLDYGGYLPPADTAAKRGARGAPSRKQALARIAEALVADALPHYAMS